MTLEEWRDKHRDDGLKALMRLEKARKRLRAFPLWKRIIFYKHFEGIRAKLKKYHKDTVDHGSMMMTLQRKIKAKRRQDKLKNETK